MAADQAWCCVRASAGHACHTGGRKDGRHKAGHDSGES